MSGSALPPLQRLHADSVYQSGLPRKSLEYWRRQPTGTILGSLLPGDVQALRVKADGRIMNGNTRIKVLEERQIDVNLLPRELAP